MVSRKRGVVLVLLIAAMGIIPALAWGGSSFPDYVERAKAAEKFKYLSVKTVKVEIDGDRGVVFLEMGSVTPFMPKGFKQMLQDLWLNREGQWVHKFSDK